jgi:single-stranded-DNA-specific exonuclease
MAYKWKILSEEPGDLVGTLLKNRGIEKDQSAAFLSPDWDRDIHDPALFTAMDAAVARTFDAMEKGEKIVIHGDYDADGISGTTLVFGILKEIADKLQYTLDVKPFLPDRERDGYGVAMHTIERFGKEGVRHVITVDCGIANADELDRAHELGISVVVCDHHQLGERLPEHAMIIHPLAPGESYPNKKLCGTGVAFKFGTSLLNEARKRGADFPVGYEKWYLDLVAIATVTDVMPLQGENRVLEHFGLLVLNKTQRPGLKELIQMAGCNLGGIDTQSIGFRIGPRINAAGRIGSAETAFRALSAKTGKEATDYAAELEMLNRQRQRISEASYEEAHKIVHASGKKAPIHVVWQETWNPGIVGLIAGKIVSEFGVPAFALTRVGDKFVGSGRSIGGLHLVEAMRSCGDIFIKAGGHPQACGLSLKEDQLEVFKEKVTEFAREYFDGDAPAPELRVDTVLPINKINWTMHAEMSRLAPFGEGNPRPVFIAKDVAVDGAVTMGKTNKHLRLALKDATGKVWKAVGFGFGAWAEKLDNGDLVDIVYEIDINEWNGSRTLQIRLIDLVKTN